jgi:hypothetical protein
MIVDQAGRILVSGVRSGQRGYLTRFNESGSEDLAFRIEVERSGSFRAHRLLELPNRKIMILGGLLNSQGQALAPRSLYRLQESGALEASFE